MFPRALLVGFLLGVLVSFGGCGKSDSTSSTKDAADPNKPLAGASAASSQSQFVGTWFRLTDGEFTGMEFQSDGKVKITNFLSDGSAGIVMTYALGDGGKLTLTRPDGQFFTYQASISGDVLELKSESLGILNNTQRMRRLPEGTSIAQAIKDEAAAKARARQERLAAIDAFIHQPGLVLVMGSGDTLPSTALDLSKIDASGFSGQAWHDEKPPHLDQISGRVLAGDEDPQIQLNFGPQIQPVTVTNTGGGQVALTVTGEPNNLKVSGKVQYGENGTPIDLTMKSDPALHDQITKRFDSEMARIASLKKPLMDALKAYAVLDGQSDPAYQPSNQKPWRDSAHLVLVASKDPGTWFANGQSIDGRTGRIDMLTNMAAVVEIIEDKPMLRITGLQRVYELTLDSSGKLTGGWFQTGAQQGKAADFSIGESLNASDRAAEIDEQRKTLASLVSYAPIVTLAKSRAGTDPDLAVSLLLKPAADGSIVGTAKLMTSGGVFDVKGQIMDAVTGPQLVLNFNYTGHDNGLARFNLTMPCEPWTITVSGRGDSARLMGLSVAGLFELFRADPAWVANQKQQLANSLKTGMKFIMRGDIGEGDPPIFQIKLDENGKITGPVIDTRRNGFQKNSTMTGELKDQDGMILLATQIAAPQIQGKFRPVYVANLFCVHESTGWRGLTISYPTHSSGSKSYWSMVEMKD